MQEVRRNFRDVWEHCIDGSDDVADVSLAAFVLQHASKSGSSSVGYIGIPSNAELRALNSLVPSQASLVIAVPDLSGKPRIHVNALIHQLEQEGYESRIRLADLTLPGRWPRLLLALAATDIGVVSLDARWASNEPEFWLNLGSFARTSESVFCVRGALDFEHPDVAIAFFRSMPADSGIEVIAATCTAIWFAQSGPTAATLREMLRTSGMFTNPSVCGDVQADAPVVACGSRMTALITLGDEGQFPRAVYTVSEETGRAGLEFVEGWSSPEADGCWTDGDAATVMVTLPSADRAAKRLFFTGNAWVPPNAKTQVIEFGVGTSPTKWHKMSFVPEEIKTIEMQLPTTDKATNRSILQIKVDKPGSPSNFGDTDQRMLGFKLRALTLFTS
jgi:hypothetical protein